MENSAYHRTSLPDTARLLFLLLLCFGSIFTWLILQSIMIVCVKEKLSGMQIFSDKKLYVSVVVVVILVAANAAAVVPQ